MSEKPTDRQRRYAENIARGMDSRAAARAAGYSESFSLVAASRLGKKAEVMKAIEDIRSRGRELAVYDLTTAMEEANSAAEFAREKGQAMALVKATELRAKLSGLLIEKVEVVSVDLTKALLAAEARVANGVDVTPLALPRPAQWRAHISGDPLPADPESGPADAKSDSEVKKS